MASRKFRSRRKVRRRSRTKRTFKRTGRRRISRGSLGSQPMIKVARKCYLGVFTPGTAATNGFWQYRTVTLANGFNDQAGTSMGGLSNLGEYTPLFDLYKLSAFKIELRPTHADLNTSTNATNAITNVIPYCTIIKDPATGVIPAGTYTAANLNTFLENGRARTQRADKPIVVYMKPKVTEQFGSGATRYIPSQWTQLNDAGGQTMPHRGYHMFFHNQGLAALATYQYDVWITYYLRFKGAK